MLNDLICHHNGNIIEIKALFYEIFEIEYFSGKYTLLIHSNVFCGTHWFSIYLLLHQTTWLFEDERVNAYEAPYEFADTSALERRRDSHPLKRGVYLYL